MTVFAALSSFFFAAAILTLTPGLDTILVIRTRMSAGVLAGVVASAGVAAGCLIWGIGVAAGLGAVLHTAPLVYEGLKIVGAIYLFWTGLGLIWRPRDELKLGQTHGRATGHSPAFARGFLTNLLNPKVGLFYLSFLPQFVPFGVSPVPFMVGLALMHATMGLIWLSALSRGLGVLESALRRPTVLRWLDRLTGGVFVAFGLKLALDRG